MLPPQDIDAELHDWMIVMHPSRGLSFPTILGTIRSDRKERFADGRMIQTSFLLTPVEQVREGAIVRTLNTAYLLVGPAAQRN